jgi:glycoside/pentoside/hexuronide:cation symporter, GPH family
MTHVSFKEKVGFSVGEYASSMVWQTLMFFLPIFYTDTFGLTAGTLATMFIVVRLFDAFSDPIMGMIADRTRSRWGRFRPYIVWMAVPYGLGFVLMFTTPDLSMSGKVFYAYATYGIMMLLYTAISIPYNSMIGVVSPDQGDRTSIASYKFIFAYLAGVSVQFMIVPMVQRFGAGNSAQGYTISMSIFAAIAVGLFLITFFSARERVQPDPEQETRVRTDLKDLLKNRPWVILFFVSLASLIFIAIRSAAVSYYFKYNLGRESEMGLFMALGTLMTLLGVLPTRWLAGKIGKIRLFKICFIIVSLTNASFYFYDSSQILLIYVVQAIGAFAGGPIFPLLWGMIADTVDYSEWKTGRRATGLAFSALTFSQKMGFAIGGWMVMSLFAAAGFVANELQPESALLGIRLSVSLIPAAIGLVGAGLLFLYDLDEKRVAEIGAELELRRHRRREPSTAVPT